MIYNNLDESTHILPRYMIKDKKNNNIKESYSIDINNIIYDTVIEYKSFDVSLIPSDSKITTISCSGSLNVNINLLNMLRYIKLSDKCILSIKYMNIYRSLKNMPKKVLTNKYFDNQATLVVQISNDRMLNIKLFKNGSYQISGCKNISEANILLNKIITILSYNYYIIINNKIVDIGKLITFKDHNNTNICSIVDFHIDMINIVYDINYMLDMIKLVNILRNDIMLKVSYESNIHQAINIKYLNISYYTKKKQIKHPTILIFSSGSIKLTGARSINDICIVYNYIMDILNTNKDHIINKNPKFLLTYNDIKEIEDDYDSESVLPDYDDEIL